MCLLATACVPLVETYYAPSAETGELVTRTCRTLGPSDAIEFTFDAVEIMVFGSRYSLILRIRVPGGNSVALGSTALQVQSGGSDEVYDLEEFSYTNTAGRRSVRIAVGGLLVGADEPFLFGKEPRLFQSLIEFNKTMGGSYKVELPAFTVNEKAFHVPEITFTEATGFGIYPINC